MGTVLRIAFRNLLQARRRTLLLGSAVGHVIRGGEPDEVWADRLLTLLWPALTPPD